MATHSVMNTTFPTCIGNMGPSQIEDKDNTMISGGPASDSISVTECIEVEI